MMTMNIKHSSDYMNVLSARGCYCNAFHSTALHLVDTIMTYLVQHAIALDHLNY